jgi:hypothetical protein
MKRNHFPPVLVLGVVLLSSACRTAPQPEYSRMPLDFASGEKPSALQQVLRRAPNVTWERATKLAGKTDYWVVPGSEPFYLFRSGVQFIGGESALRYTTNAGGFDLLTVEKKPGVFHHPACPGWAPELHCIDEHTLLIVTSVHCGARACDYDFVIIDYFNKLPFLSNPPAIKEIIDYVLDDRQDGAFFPYHFAARFNEKHRTSGNITSENPLWLDFIGERFEIIQAKIDSAVAQNEIRIVGD